MSLSTQTTTYSSAGTYTYTVPLGISALQFYLWGAGGAAGTAGPATAVISGSEKVLSGSTVVTAATPGTPSIYIPSQTITISASTQSITVPQGVTHVTITAVGGGGGRGGFDDGGAPQGLGAAGYGGQLITTTLAVTPGSTISVNVGSAGGAGANQTARSGGGSGGTGAYPGDSGGYPSGYSGTSGAGGGGGGASSVAINGTIVVVAAGGGGGGGGSDYVPGSTATGSNGYPKNNSGDGGGGGGGGGGVVTGADGSMGSDKSFAATSGATGTGVIPSGSTTATASNAGQSGYVLISYSSVNIAGTPGAAAVVEPLYTDIPEYSTVSGGAGGLGSGGGFSSRIVQVHAGDIIKVVVGEAAQSYLGGASLLTPTNYSGGTAAIANSSSGQGGGGGGASVILINGNVVGVAAGGGGGGGGGPSGAIGGSAGPTSVSGVASGVYGIGQNSSSGPVTGGGGGGGWYGGSAGSSGSGAGGGGLGGVNFGTIIQSGSGTAPGGALNPIYPGNNAGYAGQDGAAVLVFTRTFNISIKESGSWLPVDNAWVKVSNSWKALLNAWVKVNGSWQPLIASSTITGAENLISPAITYSISANVASANEGNAIAFTLTTTGLSTGTNVNYTLTGYNPTFLSTGSLSGHFTVGTGNTAVISTIPAHTTTGPKTLGMIIDNTTANTSVIINNTSLSTSYSVSANVSSVNEGNAVRFTVANIQGVPGTTITYDISGIASNRIVGGQTSGNFVIGSSEYVDVAIVNNYHTDGYTNMVLTLEGQGSSAGVIVNDTSLTPSGTMTWNLPGTYYWTVPGGVYGLTIEYITATGIQTALYATTPGANVAVTISTFGNASSFGTFIAPVFDAVVFHFQGNIDDHDYFTMKMGNSIASETVLSYTGTGGESTHQNGAAAVGIELVEGPEYYHGDLTSTVTATAIPSAALVTETTAYGVYNQGRYQYDIFSAGGAQRPTQENGYIGIWSPYDPGNSEGYYDYTVHLQQIVPIVINWGPGFY